MSVELTTKFAPQTDDLFKAESKVGLLTNTDYDWTGAHAIKLYKISTTPLNDYSRNRSTAPEDTSESRPVMASCLTCPQPPRSCC